MTGIGDADLLRGKPAVPATGLVIGAGPAGLMAADAMASAGLTVTIADRMPSPARKFLMAGKSGLNLTRAEAMSAFRAAFDPLPEALDRAFDGFGPDEVADWARGLGQEVFTGSSGRVFPVAMKASPLLRAWLERLDGQGVTLRRRWRWTGWDEAAAAFDTPDGAARLDADVTVLALGGASWARLGSDGAWADGLADVAPFRPANMGFGVAWSPHMAPQFGQPVKGCALIAGGRRHRGEFVVTARGIEGGGVYAVSHALRDGAALTLDLFPDLTVAQVRARLARPRGRTSLTTHLRKALRLNGARLALVLECAQPLPDDPASILKGLPIAVTGPHPMDEAISTAGGLRFDALTPDLMLRARPGTFAAGEMLDWEAPTGGYLISASLATGRAAGRAAAAYAFARARAAL